MAMTGFQVIRKYSCRHSLFSLIVFLQLHSLIFQLAIDGHRDYQK